MRVRRLLLDDFRSYPSLDLTIDGEVALFVGPNGAGKTNLLEALVLLAHGASSRATDDADLVRWGADHTRIRAYVERAEGERTLEALVFAHPAGERRRPKRFRLDGAARRAAELAGELRVVAFFPEEIALLQEAPSARRRYLDTLIGQVDAGYRRVATELQRVLEQRNALLRAARDEGQPLPEEELAFWDAELARLGGTVAAERLARVEELLPHFRSAHERLAGDPETTLAYVSQVGPGDATSLAEAYRTLLLAKREQEQWQGTTLVGPHRDDLRVSTRGRALPTFASRGEHRTAILALKVAEAAWIVEQTAEQPVFLLDDALSELDATRRERVVESIPRDAQCFITAAVAAAAPPALASRARRCEVSAGSVRCVD